MKAFIVEKLFSTGWRRSGVLLWTFPDATREANIALDEENARAVRILPALISDTSVWDKSKDESGVSIDE